MRDGKSYSHALRFGREEDLFSWFTEGFDTADLKEPKALLDDLSEKPSAPSPSKSWKIR